MVQLNEKDDTWLRKWIDTLGAYFHLRINCLSISLKDFTYFKIWTYFLSMLLYEQTGQAWTED